MLLENVEVDIITGTSAETGSHVVEIALFINEINLSRAVAPGRITLRHRDVAPESSINVLTLIPDVVTANRSSVANKCAAVVR